VPFAHLPGEGAGGRTTTVSSGVALVFEGAGTGLLIQKLDTGGDPTGTATGEATGEAATGEEATGAAIGELMGGEATGVATGVALVSPGCRRKSEKHSRKVSP
jgi:hypothetical protein